MDSTLGVAVFGAGRAGAGHARAVAQTPGAQLVAVFDVVLLVPPLDPPLEPPLDPPELPPPELPPPEADVANERLAFMFASRSVYVELAWKVSGPT